MVGGLFAYPDDPHGVVHHGEEGRFSRAVKRIAG